MAQGRRYRLHHAAHPDMGSARRKPLCCRRAMACSCSGVVLSGHGNSVDHPLETLGSLDADGVLAQAGSVGRQS